MRFLTVVSPAKLNLILRVLGKRKDGYHELVTLFHRISLRDSLTLEKRKEGIHLICSHPRVPIKNNLIIRAFNLLRQKHPFSGGVTVRLEKRIPIGGGLGGGSSNAASFLIGMNRLFRLRLSQKELLRLGKKLGADVAFFLTGARQAVGRGRGDKIQPLPFRGRLWFLLFPSRRGLSTAKVYAGLKSRRFLTAPTHDVRIPSAFAKDRNLGRLARLCVNDLTESAERVRTSLKNSRERLSALHLGMCQMSGSGPTLFMVFPSETKARIALRQIRRQILGGQTILLCHSF